jgi:hypothetical protein
VERRDSPDDNPAAPNNGTAHARRFGFEACFDWDMEESSHTFTAVVRLCSSPTAETCDRFR